MLYDYDDALMEMHILAYIYHWDRDTIRNIGIRERRKWTELIVEQKNRENKSMEDATKKK